MQKRSIRHFTRISFLFTLFVLCGIFSFSQTDLPFFLIVLILFITGLLFAEPPALYLANFRMKQINQN